MSLLSFVGDFFGGLWDFAKNVWDGIKTTFNNFLEDPLPTIAAVVLQETAGVPMYVTNTAIAAARGAPMEQMVLDLAKGYVAQQAGKYVGEQLAPNQGIDVTGGLETAVAPDIFKTVLTQASAQGAKAALDGKNFNEILSSSVSGAITGYVTANIRSLGLSSQFQTDLYSKAVSAATNAILGGKSVAEAVGAAISKTTLESSVTSLTGDLKKTVDQRSDAYNQYAAIQQQAKQLYEGKDGVGTLIDQARDLERSNQSIAAARQETLNNINTKVPLFNELVELSRSQSSPERFYEILSKPELGRYTIDTDPITGQTYAFKINPITNTTEKITYFSDSHIQFMYRLQNDLQNNIERMGLMDSAQVENNKLAQSLTEQLSTKLPQYEALIDQADDLYEQITNYDSTITNQSNSLQTAAQEYAQFVEDEISRLSDQVKTETNKYLEQELENAYQAKLAAEKTQLEAADALDKSYADPSEVRETLAKLGLDSFSNSRLIDQFIGKSEVGLEDTIKETLDPYILDQSELQALAEEEGYKGNYSQFQGQFLDSTQLEDWEDYVRNQFDKQSLTKDEAILKFHNAGIFDQKYIDENLDKVMSGASKWGYESAADDVVKQLKSDFLQKEQIAKQEQEQEALRQQALLKQNPSTIDDVRIAQSTQPNWLFNSRFYDENKFVGIPKDKLVQAFYDNYSNNTSTYGQVIGGLMSRGFSERGAENAFNSFSRSEGWNYQNIGPAILEQKLDAFTDRVNLTPDEVRKIANDVGYDIPESEIANYVYKNDALSASYFNLADSVKQQLDAKSVTPDEVIEYFEKQGIKDPKYIQENLPKYVGNRDEASLPLTLKNDYSAYQTQQATEARLAAERADAEKQAFVTQQKGAAEAERLRLIAEERAANQAITQPGTQPPDDGQATATEIEKIAQEVGQPTRPIEQVATGPTTSTDVAPARTIEQLQEFVRQGLMRGPTELYFPGQLAGLQAIVNKLREGGFEDEFILDYLKSEQEKSADNFIDLLISHAPQQPTGGQGTSQEDKRPAAGLAIGESATPPDTAGGVVIGGGSGQTPGLAIPSLIAVDSGKKTYDLGNGFTLFAFSDGKQRMMNNETGVIVELTTPEIAQNVEKLQAADAQAQEETERQRLLAEEQRVAEGLRIKEENDRLEAEQQRVAEEERQRVLADQQRIAEEQRLAEERRVAEEENQKVLAEQQRQQELLRQQQEAEQARIAEQERLAAEEKLRQEALATQQREAEEARIAEEQRQQDLLRQQQAVTTETTVMPTETQPSNDEDVVAREDVAALEARINELVAQAQAQGQSSDAALNSAINKVASDLGTSQASVLQELGKTKDELQQEFSRQFSVIGSDVQNVRNQLTDEINAARQAGLSGDAALQAAINNLSIDLGTSKEALLSQLGTTEAQLRQDVAQQISGVTSRVTDVESRLSAAIADAKAAGITGDAALQQAINNVASDLGTTKDVVLNQVGKTEQELRSEFSTQLGGVRQELGRIETDLGQAILDARASGKQGIDAVQAAVDQVAAGLGTTREDLLAKLGTTESQLRQDFASQLGGVQTQIETVQTRLQQEIQNAVASGKTGDAALQTAINKVSTDLGTTRDALLAQLGTTEAQLRQDVAQQISGVSAQVTDLESRLSAAIAEAKVSGAIGDGALQAGINKVASDLGTTKEELLSQLGTTESQLKADFASQLSGVTQQVTNVESRLTSAIAEARAAGQTGDAALQAGINQVAAELGTTKEQLLAQVGKTESQLRADMQAQVGGVESRLTAAIAEARQSGLQGDAALQAGINKVAADLSTTKDIVLEQVGKTESQLRQEMQAGQAQTGQQIADLNTSLQKAINQAQAEGKAGDAALQAGINKVAGDLGTTKEALLGQLGKTEQQLRSDFATQLGGVQAQIGTVQADLTKAIADAKAQGQSDVEAVRSAVNQVSTDLGITKDDLLNRLQETESSLQQKLESGQLRTQEQIQELSTTQQQQYQQLTQSQKQLYDQMVAQGASQTSALNTAMAGVQQQITTGLAGVSAEFQAQLAASDQATKTAFANMSAAQQAEAAARVAQGQSLQQSISDVQAGLGQQITSGLAGLSAEFQEKLAQSDNATKAAFASMSAAQQAEAAARVAQGESLQKSISDVQSGLGQQLTAGLAGVSAEFQAKLAQSDAATQAAFQQMNANQQAETQARVQQGQSLQTAISDVQATLGQQITTGLTDVESRLKTAMAANEAAGLSRDQAISKAVDDVAASVGTTKDDLLSRLGQTESSLRQQYETSQAQTQAQISQLDAATQARFNQMSEAQKTQALQLAQSTQDLQGAINTVSQQTTAQISSVSKTLSDQIAANEAAGLSRDAAITKSVEDVAASLGTTKDALLAQLGTTEQGLRAEFTTGLAGVEAGLTGQIGALSQQTQAQYAALSDAQKREVEARTQMGESLSDAIAGVSTTLTGRISELSTATQQQFANLTEAQKQEVAARFQQGQDLQDAISSVESKLGTKIETGLGGLESKLNDQGRAILAQLEQQGVGYQTALQTALAQQEAATQEAISGVSRELSDVQTQFNNRVDELIAQGQSQEQATQQAFTELRGSVSQLSAAQQAQATQQQAAQQQAAQQQASSANISLLGTLGLGLGGLGALGALPGAAGAAPSQAMKSERFMVGAAPQTQFEGPLEQFLKMSTTGYSQQPYGQQPAEEPAMNYYSYGQPSSIDNLLGMSPEEDELQVKSGGLIAPLMAAGGYAPGGLNVINHSGKARIDFRKGAHVAGPGDGQSDDIPAMLADGEFVFPADVVAALGNGSTKAGSDKLYEMMHSIRARARSAKPKDLPPPALKSPLDYLGRR